MFCNLHFLFSKPDVFNLRNRSHEGSVKDVAEGFRQILAKIFIKNAMVNYQQTVLNYWVVYLYLNLHSRQRTRR